MESSERGLDLGVAESTTEIVPPHVPSEIQADTLFTFMPMPEYLHTIIKKSMISPRYCSEDIAYLRIDGISRVSIPMKCFCDINLHRLGKHLACYGYYGIAFTKEWGMQKHIQPVQYINPESDLRADFTAAFNHALRTHGVSETETEHRLKNYMLHQLMYSKPYSGSFKSRVDGEMHDRCFADECEWRYIPNLQGSDFPAMFFDDQLLKAGTPNDMSDAMARESSLALQFEYNEVKHIIVRCRNDFHALTSVITELPIERSIMYDLISKVIVWDESKGDF